MTQHLATAKIAELARIAEPPALAAPAPSIRSDVDRSFGLPARLYGATVALYLGFIGVMSLAFMNAELAIPMAVFAGFILIAFALAGKWVTMAPANPTRQPDWGRFRDHGIVTASGRLSARDASVQVLLLPVLIFLWGVAVAVIRASV